MPSKTRVLILGGGFGGLYAALHLDKTIARDRDIEVTLVSRENFVLFTPMLPEVAAGDLDLTDIVSPLRQMLKHTNVLVADVESIDPVETARHHRLRVESRSEDPLLRSSAPRAWLRNQLLQSAGSGRVCLDDEIVR
jgi:2-polyprenyl-6-methoxyphenol hydroxylase-like FAD-dependent oxidoreductase